MTAAEKLQGKLPAIQTMELMLKVARESLAREEEWLRRWEAKQQPGNYGELKKRDIMTAQARVDAIRECLEIVQNGGLDIIY